mgnify:FL=1
MKVYMVLNRAEETIDVCNVPFKYDRTLDLWSYDVKNPEWMSLEVNKEDGELFNYVRKFMDGPERPVELYI